MCLVGLIPPGFCMDMFMRDNFPDSLLRPLEAYPMTGQ